MKMNLVTVVIPCYNHEHFVQKTIQSVIDQSYKNIELIIIDDGSKDDSVTKIEEMLSSCKQRFKRFEFRYRPNKGLSNTLNEALNWSKGDFFSPIASDDIMLPNKISSQVSYLNNDNDCIGVFGNVEIIGGKDIVQSLVPKKKKIKKYKFNDIYLHRHNLPAPTQLLKADFLKMIGGYNAEVLIEDWYIYLLMTNNNNFHLANINEVVCCYRRHLNNTSSNTDSMHNGRLSVLELFPNEKYYEKARFNCFLATAIELLPTSKAQSLSSLLEAIKVSPEYIFQLRVIKYFIRLLF